MISGVVIHISDDGVAAAQALQAIASELAIELGERVGNRLPAVLDASGPRETQEITDWLLELPGVVHVDVAFVDLEGSDPDRGAGQHGVEE